MMRQKKTSGFSLLEMLLVIALFSTFLMGLMGIFDNWSQRAINRKAAQQILQLQAAAVQYVESNYASFTSDSVNVFYQIPMTDLATGVYMPTGYDGRNVFRQQMRVFRRKLEVPQLDTTGAQSVDTAGTLIWKTVFEVLTITDNPSASHIVRIPNNFLSDIVQAGGTKLGVFSEMGAGASRITSPLNEWYLSYTGGMLPGFGAVPDPQGGYLAAYEVIASTSLKENDNYLYRVEIPGRPELNQMRTDLYMNSNNIENIGTLTVDMVNLTGDAAFLGNGEGAGDVLALTIDQALQVNGNGIHRVAMKSPGMGCVISTGANDTRRIDGAGCTALGGELQVISADLASLYVDSTFRSDGSIITDNTNIVGVTEAYGTSTFDNINGDMMRAYDEVIAPNVEITGASLTTQQLQAGNVGVANGFSSAGGLTAARVSPTNGLGVYTERLDLDNVAEVGTFVTNVVNVTTALDFTEMGAVDGTPMTFSDLELPPATFNGTMSQVCTFKADNAMTYCEPSGSFLFTQNTDVIRRRCYVNAFDNGYWCEDWRTNPASAPTYIDTSLKARCFFERIERNGVAEHDNPVCSFS